MRYCGPRALPHSAFLAWTDDDQDKALAWQQFERSVCPGCGTREDEWERDRFAYVGDLYRCPGCEVLSQERENAPEHARGVHARLVTRAYSEQMAGD